MSTLLTSSELYFSAMLLDRTDPALAFIPFSISANAAPPPPTVTRRPMLPDRCIIGTNSRRAAVGHTVDVRPPGQRFLDSVHSPKGRESQGTGAVSDDPRPYEIDSEAPDRRLKRAQSKLDYASRGAYVPAPSACKAHNFPSHARKRSAHVGRDRGGPPTWGPERRSFPRHA